MFEARFPYALMIAPLPAWTKVLWIAIRGFQGAGDSCRASYTTIGERCLNDQGNEMDKAQISRGVSVLIEAGFLERVGTRHLRCITPPISEDSITRGAQNVDAASTNEAENVDAQSTNTPVDAASTLITHQRNVDHPSTPSENQQENQQGKDTILTDSDGSPEKPIGDLSRKEKEKRHPALGIYRSIVRLSLHPEAEKLIIEHVGNEHLKTWKAVLRETVVKGWNKQNIQGIIDRYHERLNGHRYEQQRRHSKGIQQQRAEFSVRDGAEQAHAALEIIRAKKARNGGGRGGADREGLLLPGPED